MSAVRAAKGVAKTLALHRPAVVGFLFGFFLVLLLYTILSGQLGSEDAIVRAVTTQPTPAVHTDRNARTTSPTSPMSMLSNATEGNNRVQENRQKSEESKIIGEDTKDNVHGTDRNNQDGGKLGKNTEQFNQPAVNDENDKVEEELIQQDIDQDGRTNDTNTKFGAPRNPICDLSDPRFDVCEIFGDARAMGTKRTVLYVPPVGELGTKSEEWSIRDQSRKYLEYINKVTVRSLNVSQMAPNCTSRHTVPAVVFAMNGLTSNPWHDFSDVLIPLFITSRAFNGEVQFLVSDLQPWFVDKYRLILRNLSRYDIIDFNQDSGVRCYPQIVVGLRSHRDLGIDPARAPGNYTMLDFRLYIRDVYLLPPASVDIPFKETTKQAAVEAASAGMEILEQRRPRLMLINRGRTRRFVNFPEIAAAVEAAGFEVLPIEPRRDLGIEEFSRVVDSCDVLMGAHGAGLTNFFFLRTNAVVLQVVPWGHMEHSSMVFYGGPSREMKLRDVEYSISAEESTLYDNYGKDNPVISDPESIHKKGWQFGMKYYWIEQDIKLNVTRFAPTLQQVLQMIKG